MEDDKSKEQETMIAEMKEKPKEGHQGEKDALGGSMNEPAKELFPAHEEARQRETRAELTEHGAALKQDIKEPGQRHETRDQQERKDGAAPKEGVEPKRSSSQEADEPREYDHRTPGSEVRGEATLSKPGSTPENKEHRPWSEADSQSFRECLDRIRESPSFKETGKAPMAEVEQLKQVASRIDFQAETNGNHVLYAGKDNGKTAEEFTQQVDGYKTLNQTKAGEDFSNAENLLSREQRLEVFGALSQRFTDDAKGTLVVFDYDRPKSFREDKLKGDELYQHNVDKMSIAHLREFESVGNNHRIDNVVFDPPMDQWNRFDHLVQYRRNA